MIRTVAFVNNAISAALTRADLAARGLDLAETAVILGRPLDAPWLAECGAVLCYPGKPSLSLWGQRRFVAYYRAAARLLAKAERAGSVGNLYIPNNDNLVTSHMIAMARRDPAIVLSVAAEGLMNFQRIEPANRAAWRWRVKPVIARALGLDYRMPHGHLSGAFEPEVTRVISFATEGLKAPPEKVEIIAFPRALPARPADPKVALVALTGIAHWMQPDAVAPLARAFSDWIVAQGYSRLLVKPHPMYGAGAIGAMLPLHETVTDSRSLEEMAGELQAGTILGICCTGLVTLKLMRPDLHCVDFGSDYYQRHAYGGDSSVETLLRAAGVTIVPMGSG